MRLYIGKTIETYSQASAYEIGTNRGEWDGEYGFKIAHIISVFEIPIEKTEKILTIKLASGEIQKLAPGEIRKVKSITIELE